MITGTTIGTPVLPVVQFYAKTQRQVEQAGTTGGEPVLLVHPGRKETIRWALVTHTGHVR